MRALLACRADPRRVPVLLLQAGIHPGESDGKDAGFIALREILGETAAPGVLERMAILFVPAFNVDGHERFGRWNRPNQNGPEEMGWRTTAQNLNLNRDYTKADAPEMRALLKLIREWDPLVCADLHVTDGADFQPDISLQAEPVNQGDARLYASGRELRDALIAKVARSGSMPLPFYPDFAEPDDPASGFLLTVYSPRFSTGYFPQRNRFTVLVETHSWKDYATRVRVTRNTIIGLAELVAAHGAQWREETRQADATAARLGGADVVLDYSSGWREGASGARTDAVGASGSHMIDFPGYAYTRDMSAISGEPVTVYDPKTPQVWRVPYRDQVSPSLVVKAPRGGYVLPPAWVSEIGARLAFHGIQCEPMQATRTGVHVEAYRASAVHCAAAPFEGRMRATLTGSWQRETQDVAAGGLFVPIAQPLARLRDAPPGTGGSGLFRVLGVLQCLLRAEGIHGTLCRRADRAHHARRAAGARRAVRAQTEGRPGVRGKCCGAAGFLPPPPQLVGLTLQSLPGPARGRVTGVAASRGLGEVNLASAKTTHPVGDGGNFHREWPRLVPDL